MNKLPDHGKATPFSRQSRHYYPHNTHPHSPRTIPSRYTFSPIIGPPAPPRSNHLNTSFSLPHHNLSAHESYPQCDDSNLNPHTSRSVRVSIVPSYMSLPIPLLSHFGSSRSRSHSRSRFPPRINSSPNLCCPNVSSSRESSSVYSGANARYSGGSVDESSRERSELVEKPWAHSEVYM
jgi:hypothetical protein